MPLNFRIGSLSIRDFRCIHKLEIEFPECVPTYLIGGNNAGKSTVMNGIALALRGGGFHQFIPESFDYFHDARGSVANEFEIRLQFTAKREADLPAVQGVGSPEFVHGIRVKGTTDRIGNFQHTHRLYGSDGKVISFSQQTPLKADLKEKFKGHEVGWKPRSARPDDIRESVPEVWLLRADNLYRSLYEWRTGPLRQLSKLLTKQFLSQDWTFNYRDKPQEMPEKIRLLHDFFSQAVSEFPFWKNDLKPKLEESLSRYIGRQSTIALQPTIQALEEWLTQQLLISFSADVGGAVTPLKCMGDGWQSLVRVAALDVLRQYPDECKEKVALLFEEPETYLHPHLRRKLRNVLGELSELGWFVVCATHAPEFVSFSGSQQIVRLWRNGDQIDKGALLTKSVSDAAKFQERLDEHGNHEMLFANRIVLCEGKDDEFAVKEYFGKSDLDVDGRSLSVLDLGGVVNLPDYATMAQALKIPWSGLTDEDRDATGAVNPITEGVRKRLKVIQSPADFVVSWPGSLEASLGIVTGQKAKPAWQQANLSPKSLKEIKKQYPDYSSTCEAISKWICSSNKPTKAESS